MVRGVEADGDAVTVTITPTYSGCPAIEVMRDDLRAELTAAGFTAVEVRTVLSPAWSTDWISAAGRRKLAEHGIAPPDHVGPRATGPIPLTLTAPSAVVRCPRCGSPATERVLPVRPDGLHGAAPLRRLPGAVRAHEGDLR